MICQLQISSSGSVLVSQGIILVHHTHLSEHWGSWWIKQRLHYDSRFIPWSRSLQTSWWRLVMTGSLDGRWPLIDMPRQCFSPLKQVDCFFLLCIVYKFGTHIALVHMDGIWSTHRNSVLCESDLMLAQTTDGFREVLCIKDDIQLYETLGDAPCLDTLWTNQPPIFVASVVNPYGHAEDEGYRIQPGQEPRKLKQILSNLMGVLPVTYHHFVRKWFHEHLQNHWIAHQWWDQHQLTWPLYHEHLDSEYDADGLEVLAVSAVMRTHLNILQDEQIWTLHRNDYSEWDVTIVIGVEGVLLYEWPDPVPSKWEMSGAESSTDTLSANVSMESGDVHQLSSGIPESVQKLVKTLGGRQCMRSLHREYPVDLGSPTRADKDLSNLRKLYTVSKHSNRQCRAPDTQCPDCDFVAVRNVDLYWHIKDNHPASKTYACWDCDKNFQTDHDHINHMNIIHRAKAFSCTECLFTAAKFECASCEIQLATKSALCKHTLLHLLDEEHKCSQCDKLYASKLALQVHTRGKHGQGYQCPQCNKVFDALIKKARHLKKCKTERSKSATQKSPSDA